MGKPAETDRHCLPSLSHLFTLDGIVCCCSQQEAQAALKVVEKLLARLDLAINPRKTAIQHVEKGFDYLGERFFFRHTGHGEEAVMVRPVNSVPVQAVIPPHRRLQAAPAIHHDNGEESVWEPSI